METLDWVVIAGYFALLLGLSWWVILQKNDTSQEFFLAAHSLGWFVVGASIFASNIGSLLVFIPSGATWWGVGLAMAVGQVAGAALGARVAMRVGARLIKPLLVCVSTVMALR